MDSRTYEDNEDSIESEEVINNLTSVNKHTEEEFQNFMQRVTEIKKIVTKLASDDRTEQELGQILADKILDRKNEEKFSEVEELKIKTNRTCINKYPVNEDTSDPNKMGQGRNLCKKQKQF